MQKLTDQAVEELKLVAVESAGMINSAHEALLEDCRAAQERATTAKDRALFIGAELEKVKLAVGHGKFLAWVEAHCSFDQRTAQRYMQFSKATHESHLTDDLSLRQAMVKLGIIPHRPREGSGTYRGGGVPSVYDPLNALTRFLGAVDNSGTPQEWETNREERLAVQQQYKPKLEELILRLYGVQIDLLALA